MKKCLKAFSCLAASVMMATSASASQVELYALDGRTLFVEENQVTLYTAEGMGWYEEKPVTMYSLDGRTIVVPADRVQAHKEVGWYLEEELVTEEGTTETETPEPVTDVTIKYTDGTVVTVPVEHLETYKTLGWVEVNSEATVIMYDANGVAKEVALSDVGRYELEGWSTVRPDTDYITVYSYDGSEKQIHSSQYEASKEQGWYRTFDEAVYNYAAFGDGADVLGAEELLENKKYEQAYNMVKDALGKIESSGSEFVDKLYDLRSDIMDTWHTAAKSPLGFVNYWFAEKDGTDIIVFEYRNVTDSRITSFRINFDICDADGKIIETNSGSYFVENLQMLPCDKKKVAWAIKKGDQAKSIKNLKVKEVVFADGTKWTAGN